MTKQEKNLIQNCKLAIKKEFSILAVSFYGDFNANSLKGIENQQFIELMQLMRDTHEKAAKLLGGSK